MSTHAGVRGFVNQRNQLNIARWRLNYATTGGADLADLRSAAQRQRYHSLAFAMAMQRKQLKRAARVRAWLEGLNERLKYLRAMRYLKQAI